MGKIEALDTLIREKYAREVQLANDLGWTRQRLNKITNGNKEPDLEEVEAIAKKLEHPFNEVAYIFLRHRSPNGEQAAQ